MIITHEQHSMIMPTSAKMLFAIDTVVVQQPRFYLYFFAPDYMQTSCEIFFVPNILQGFEYETQSNQIIFIRYVTSYIE